MEKSIGKNYAFEKNFKNYKIDYNEKKPQKIYE